MTEENNPGSSFTRRTVLCYVLPSVSTAIAGCGDPSQENHQNVSDVNSTNSADSNRENTSVDFQDITEDINGIYVRLNQFPIANDSEFRFVVGTFEDEFNHRELLDEIESVRRELKNLKVASDQQKSDLLRATDVANNLVRQRIVLHQTIAAGITFEESFAKGDYGRSAQAIQDAISILSSLSDIRNATIGHVSQKTAEVSLVEAYDADSIRSTQVVLEEILQWTSPAYRGLYETSQGLQVFEEGSSFFNNGMYGSARRAFQEADKWFRSAGDTFDRAQGRGRRLPQIAPFVDGVRCMLPAYQTSSDELRRSMGEFETGNDSRAREIGREAIISAERVAKRCY